MILTPASIERFLRSLSANGSSSHTIRAYRADLTGLMTFDASLGASPNWATLEMNAAVYLTELRRKPLAPKTILRKLASFRSFAKAHGEDAFLGRYRAPVIGEPTPHPLPEGIPGVLRLIAVADTEPRKALVALCGLVGARVSEACGIDAACFNELERELTIHGKGSKTRVVPLSDAAWDALTPARLHSLSYGGTLPAIGERYARELITEFGARAGLKRPISSHDLRATFATAAYQRSGDILAVQKLLGHADYHTTLAYVAVTRDTMRAAASVVA